MGSEVFLRQFLRGFYEKTMVDSVPDISSREFGIGEFGQKISARHLAFRSSGELNSFLKEKTPFYISYSAARYELPAARPMERKNLLGADLIYEFDADEIPTECKLSHDSWKCNSCSACGKGRLLECTQCGSGVSVDEWVCPECLGETKRQTFRLLKILENDLGFSDSVFVNFSGSKGFHIHVRSENVQKFSKAARLEVLDYLTGANIDFASLGFDFQKSIIFSPKISLAKGWSKRLLESAKEVFEANDPAKLGVMGSLSYAAAQKLLKEKPRIMDGMARGKLLGVIGVNAEKFWRYFLSSLIDSEKLPVDRQTSIDINKIIRVPNTLHGSTGLQAKVVPIEELSGFEPLKNAVVLPESEVKIQNVTAPKFYLNGKWFGPYSNDSFSLPVYAAFYLLARGNGVVV